MKRALALCVLLVLAGCAAPVADERSEDELGVVAGVTTDESITTAEGALSEAELQVLVHRTMARIEVVRGVNYDESVDVDVISRAEYAESGPDFGVDDPDWADARWEALFVVGESRNASEVIEREFSARVQGYYSPTEDRVVVVGETARLDTETLVHELVHALQDQAFGFPAAGDTHDSDLSRDGLVEGEAELVTDRYFDRCGVVWSCHRTGADSTLGGADGERVASDGGAGYLDTGLALLLLFPYDAGPPFVDAIQDRGDWRAVDGLHDDPPRSTAQIFHPDRYPGTAPANVTLADRSAAGWDRLNRTPASDTLGEAAVYAMLRHNGVLDVTDREPYHHPFSAGWAGDAFVAYEGDDGATGYVWETEWETATDADQFEFAYSEVLESSGAVEQGENRYVIRDGPFADAFRVTRSGTTVRVVNGPTVESLAAIHSH